MADPRVRLAGPSGPARSVQIPSGDPEAWKAKLKPRQLGMPEHSWPQSPTLALAEEARGVCAARKSMPTTADDVPAEAPARVGAPHVAPHAPSRHGGRTGALPGGVHHGLKLHVRLAGRAAAAPPPQNELPTLVKLLPDTSLYQVAVTTGGARVSVFKR